MICKISEKAVTVIIFLVMYITTYEFVVINPLAPDYIIELGILTSEVGMIVGSYSLAAAVSGLTAITFIDKHDRKKILTFCLIGVLIGDIFSILSVNFVTFLLSTIFKGFFAGPATAIGLAILSDVVAPERRGRAMSKTTSSFPVVAAIGVPVALEISNITGMWRLAFVLNAVFIAIALIVISKNLPSINKHLESAVPMKVIDRYKNILTKYSYMMTIGLNLLSFFAGFLLIPHLANYLIFNTGYPREKLGLLYMIAGGVSFFTMRLVGVLNDKYGSLTVIGGLSIIAITSIYFEFISAIKVPAIIFLTVFMLSMSSRNVIIGALSTRIPTQHDRASFFSLFNVANHIGVGLGGFVSSVILVEGSALELQNITTVALLSICFISLVPVLVHIIERYLRRQVIKVEELPTSLPQ